jgi:hypothetical protein
VIILRHATSCPWVLRPGDERQFDLALVRLLVRAISAMGWRRSWDLLLENILKVLNGEFDSGSERTLAAWIRHASRTGLIAI